MLSLSRVICLIVYHKYHFLWLRTIGNSITVSLNDKPAVEEVRTSYEALSDEQKAMVSPEILSLLNSKEEAVRVAITTIPAGVITVIVIDSTLLLVLIACGVLYILHKKVFFVIPLFAKRDDEEEEKKTEEEQK